MADFGYFALLISLFAASYALLADILGAWRDENALIKSGRNAMVACYFCLTAAVVALLIMLPALTALAIFVGIFLGGMLIAVIELRQGIQYYYSNVIDALMVRDLITGVGKSFFFAGIIAVIGCHNGLRATAGATGVGRATTDTVVGASVAILISDFFLTKIFLLIL